MMMMAETQRRMAGHDLRLGMMIPTSPVRTIRPKTGPGRKMMCWYSFMRTAGTCTTRVPKWRPRYRETPWSVPVYALIVPIAYRRLYAGVRVDELGGTTGNRSVLSV